MSGSLTLDGDLSVSLVNGFSPSVGDSFDLFDGSMSGTFASISLPSVSGLSWDTSALYSSGVISVVAAVPEPMTVDTFLLLTGRVLLRRSRRRVM